MFNKLPNDIQDKILSYIFNKEINNIEHLAEFKYYYNKYIVNYTNKNKKISFCSYWFNLYRNNYNNWKNWNSPYNRIFIDNFYYNNRCSFCNCLTQIPKLLNNNLYNKFPKFRKMKKYELILSKTLIKNYVNLNIIDNLVICCGCYYGYSKNKNIKFYIS
jgi:hypothetical protein